MQEDIATTLGFTSSPVLERIEGGMAMYVSGGLTWFGLCLCAYSVY